jgi:SpoVK/Ycf46/Vps4 family AAA+-type ATPase
MEQNTEKTCGFFDVRDLPDPELEGYWKDIVVDVETKKALLRWCSRVLRSDSLSPTRCALYRIALLYGRTGTGKSSLALGCANRIAERELARTGKRTKLLQMNVGAWFSEFLGRTPKAIHEGFQSIRLASTQQFVIALLDELESLAIERGSLGAGDPSDVLRGVNTLINELDRLRSCPGTLVLATSNMTTAIDRAVWDRSDLRLFIGTPTREAARKILKRSLWELRKERVYLSPSLPDEVVEGLYDGCELGPLSGRDLGRLLVVAAWTGNGNHITAKDALRVARRMMAQKG